MSEEKLSAYQRWKKSLGDTRPWDLLNPEVERVSDEIRNARFDMCKSCEFLIKPTHQCKKCGCLMHVKTQLAAAECPIGKWSRTDIKA